MTTRTTHTLAIVAIMMGIPLAIVAIIYQLDPPHQSEGSTQTPSYDWAWDANPATTKE